jgi:hypothetical protein
MPITNLYYDKKISDLEKEVSRLNDMLSGKGKIVNFGKEFHVDSTIKLSEIVKKISDLEKEVLRLKDK